MTAKKPKVPRPQAPSSTQASAPAQTTPPQLPSQTQTVPGAPPPSSQPQSPAPTEGEQSQENLEKLGLGKNAVQALHLLKEFCDSVRKKSDGRIFAIWIIDPEQIPQGKEITISILHDNLAAKSRYEADVALVNDSEKAFKLKNKIAIRSVHYALTDYYDRVMRGDIDLFIEIKNSVVVFDDCGFVGPVRQLTVRGGISGTPEALTQRLLDMKKRIKLIQAAKLEILDNLYYCVITLGQAALTSAGHDVPIHKEVAAALERHFYKDGLLAKQHIILCDSVVQTYKAIEKRKLNDITGKQLDVLLNGTQDYIRRLSALIGELGDATAPQTTKTS